MASAAQLFLVLSTLFAGQEPAELSGEWVLTATKDASRADEASPSCTMTIHDGGRITFRVNQHVVNRCTFVAGRLDGRATIDLKMSDDKVLPGVYNLDRNVLTFCFDQAGKERPGGMTPTGTQWAERWERVKRSAARQGR